MRTLATILGLFFLVNSAFAAGPDCSRADGKANEVVATYVGMYKNLSYDGSQGGVAQINLDSHGSRVWSYMPLLGLPNRTKAQSDYLADQILPSMKHNLLTSVCRPESTDPRAYQILTMKGFESSLRSNGRKNVYNASYEGGWLWDAPVVPATKVIQQGNIASFINVEIRNVYEYDRTSLPGAVWGIAPKMTDGMISAAIKNPTTGRITYIVAYYKNDTDRIFPRLAEFAMENYSDVLTTLELTNMNLYPQDNYGDLVTGDLNFISLRPIDGAR